MINYVRVIGAATEVNELSRDLLYFIERLNLEPEASNQIYSQGIVPRLRRAEDRFAEYCLERKPVKSEQHQSAPPTEQQK